MALTRVSGLSPNVSVAGSVTSDLVSANVAQIGAATTVHTTGIDLGSGNLTGHNLVSTGIITAVSFVGDGSQLTGIAVGIQTEAITPSGITTHLLLSSADDHKVLATGVVTIDVTGGTEADSHTIRIENVGVATVGFSTYFLFPSGFTPSMSEGGGSIDLISFVVKRVGTAGTQLLASAGLNYQ